MNNKKKEVQNKWGENPVAKKIKEAQEFKQLDRKGYLEGDIPTVGMFVSGFLLGFSIALLFIHLLLIQVL